MKERLIMKAKIIRVADFTDDEKLAWALGLYVGGQSQREIAELAGTRKQIIVKVLGRTDGYQARAIGGRQRSTKVDGCAVRCRELSSEEGGGHTLEEMADEVGLTVERVRQLLKRVVV